MSIRKNITSLPNTGRTFESDLNGFGYVSGIFVTQTNFEFEDEEEFNDLDKWRGYMDTGKIIPLHYVKQRESLDQETEYQESNLDFSYRTYKGKYRHKLFYVWTLDKHKLVETLSGGSYRVFIYDRNNNIYATRTNVPIKGLLATRIQLEKLIQATENDPAFSPLDIEYKDPDELNIYGYIKKVDWQPTDIDRLFMSLTIEYADTDNIHFSAAYNGAPVTNINDTEVFITDDVNGVLTFSTFELGSGIYKLSGFSNTVTSGKLEVVTDVYLGCNKYRVTITVSVVTNLQFEDDDTIVLENDDFLILEN